MCLSLLTPAPMRVGPKHPLPGYADTMPWSPWSENAFLILACLDTIIKFFFIFFVFYSEMFSFIDPPLTRVGPKQPISGVVETFGPMLYSKYCIEKCASFFSTQIIELIPPSFFVSVLLSALVKRFNVSCMRDFSSSQHVNITMSPNH